MKKIAICTLFVLVCSFLISAQATNTYSDLVRRLLAASLIEDDSKRLATFDSIVLGLVTSDSDTQSFGKWSFSSDVDPLTDQTTFYFFLVADEGTSIYGEPITLVIRSTPTRIVVYIAWDSYLGSEAIVTHRFGKDSPKIAKWNLSTDSKASFFPGDNYQFVLDMLSSESFVARVTPYSENPITAVFDVRGLKATLLLNEKHHNWE